MVLENIRDTLRRKLSMKDENPNFDDHDEADDETTGYLHREVEESEANETTYSSGKPGSLLSRLIAHGNKKTEDQIEKENQPLPTRAQ